VNVHDSTGDIRSELWSVLHALKAEDMDPEKAEQMVSVLDSLRELEKLALSQAKANTRGGEAGAAFTNSERSA